MNTLAQFAKAGIDVGALATQLQDDGAKSFVKSWNELMGVISAKSDALAAERAFIKSWRSSSAIVSLLAFSTDE